MKFIFDADGVVIRGDMFSVRYAKDYGIPAEELLPFFKGVFRDCIVGKADLKTEIEPWLSRWNWHGSVDDFLEYWFKSEHQIDERVVARIEQLRKQGYPCFLATNQEKYRIRYMKEQMGFDRLFDKIFSSAEIGYQKPQPEFFKYIIRELKVPPQDIIFFDDSESHVKEAEEQGIDAYLYTRFSDFESTLKKILSRYLKVFK
ncbi:MAG: HAD-IA family hydrolase [Candidatus Woesearchaeota archaeon]